MTNGFLPLIHGKSIADNLTHAVFNNLRKYRSSRSQVFVSGELLKRQLFPGKRSVHFEVHRVDVGEARPASVHREGLMVPAQIRERTRSQLIRLEHGSYMGNMQSSVHVRIASAVMDGGAT